MRFLIRLIPVLCAVTAILVAAPPHDPDEGTLASGAPRIPEPMVYDLVRPLGAVKGELEVNSLFLQPLRRGRSLEWAPEIEYTFARGYGIELEIPMEGVRRESWKAALQGTLGHSHRQETIHGWQALSERWNHEDRGKADLLYLTGTRWHDRWSTFTMIGPAWKGKTGGAARVSSGTRASSITSPGSSTSGWNRIGPPRPSGAVTGRLCRS
jgi:hypothetical protein